MVKVIVTLENNYHYKMMCKCEPQLGKRGLYPTISQKGTYDEVVALCDFIAYADGKNDLIQISDIINQPIQILIPIAHKLIDNGLIIKD
jgi:aminopeptidase-like protein